MTIVCKSSNTASLPMKQKSLAASKTVTMVLSGIRGSGKSTLFCNLFGEPVSKIRQDTEEPEIKSVLKGSKEEVIEVRVIDTQGLVINKHPNKTLKDTKRLIKEKYQIDHFDLLVFCIPARVGARFDKEQKLAMKNIQDFHGKEIWNKCVVVFTFSNQILEKITEANEKVKINIFKSKLNDLMAEFRAELMKMGADIDKLDPKTIFNWKASKKPLQGRILGIPAGFYKDDEVLPGIELCGEGWADEIYLEMINKCEQKQLLAEHKYQKDIPQHVAIAAGVGGVAAGLGGAGAGALIGVTTGAVAGPIGAGIGAAVGALVGIATGIANALWKK